MHKSIFLAKPKDDSYYVKFAKVLYRYFKLSGFPRNFSKHSRKDFNNWQMFALQTFRQKIKLKYRPFIHWLESCTPVLRFLKMRSIPHYTKLQKFDERCKAYWHLRIIETTPKVIGLTHFFVGIDGTGFSIYQDSKHYCRRIGRKTKKKDFVKTVGVADLRFQLMLTLRIRKKSRHDNVDFKPLMKRARRLGVIDVGVGDMGFDARKTTSSCEMSLELYL